jgi:hypothetical protein
MINVSVRPGTLVAGQSGVLTIELSNAGEGACSDVAFRLKLPPGMVLAGGSDKIDVDQIPGGHAHRHQVTVLPGQAGDAEVGTTNFSYRDENGIARREDSWRAVIRVLPAASGGHAAGPALAKPALPLPRLVVRYGEGKIARDEWDVLKVFLRNTTGFPLYDVTLTVDGPFRVDPPSVQIQLLGDGDVGPAAFNIYVPDRGKVPVRMHTAYRYRDSRGHVVPGAQDDRWTIEVGAQAEPDPPRPAGDSAPVTTVLYLVAQPKNTPLLATYEEMREVETELQLGRDRERFRLEHQVAVRIRDISRALARYQPQIVNFSGHGRPDGSLAVENEHGFATYADPAGLASLLGGFAYCVRCVIVNACHSLVLAEAINEEIDYVIGMRSEILDTASVQFSVGFYQGLFAGRSVPDAFRQGRDLVQADPNTNSEYKVPRLLTR